MVQSLARGIEILLLLQKRESATIVEIAEVLDVDKSTVSRLMSTLMQYDMVSINPSNKKYRLGFRLMYLGEGVKKDFNIVNVARPYIHMICDEVKESVHLATLGNRKMYIADQILSHKPYNISAQIGMIEPWHCSSVGKCLLAFKSQSYIEEIFHDYEFKKYTPNTITTYEELKEELEKIREQRYALDNEEFSQGVCCVAVPIFHYGRNVNSCLGISVPKEQMTKENIKKYVHCMKKYSRLISEELGCESHLS
ncbi:IclR family transcriptional regulator [Roseburia hominis]